MRSGRLLGHAHQVHGAVAAVSEGPAAITLSRGGAPKTYGHTDPNEDAVCFAFGEHGVLAAVADGHYGARGAERAIDWLLRERASAWTGADAGELDPDTWLEAGGDVLQAVHHDVLAQAREIGLAPAPTTLSIALVRPREGLLLHASVGDSHIFVARQARGIHHANDVAWATTGRRDCAFAGEQYDGGQLRPDQWVVGCEPLADARAVLLASDGLSEVRIGVEDPAAAAAAAVEHAADPGAIPPGTTDAEAREASLRALEACRHLTEAALAAHRANRAGDNMCAAVIWLEDVD